eukprot:6701450-Pyramimonas_sp.AAC.1
MASTCAEVPASAALQKLLADVRGGAGKLAWRAPEGQKATLPRVPAHAGARCLGSFARPLGHVREASGA